MTEIMISGEPAPVTAGNAPVRWKDRPNRHAYCDAEIARLRGALEHAEAVLAAVRNLARSWTAPDGMGLLSAAIEAECGRAVLAVLDGTPGEPYGEQHAETGDGNG